MYDAPFPMQTDAAVPDDTRAPDPIPMGRDARAEPDAASDTDLSSSATRAREGLPKSYRSRHDRHYVEQLTSATGMPLLRMLAVSRLDAADLPDASEVVALTASIGRLGVLQPLLVRAHGDRFVLMDGRRRLVAARQAHCREVPCLVHTIDDARAIDIAAAANGTVDDVRERMPRTDGTEPAHAGCDALSDALLPELDHALTSVQRSLRLLPQSPGGTRERVAMRLAAAELDRAQWLVRCRRYLAGRLQVSLRPVAVHDLARELRGTAAGIALHGGRFEVDAARAPASVRADAALLTAAVHGLAWTLLALGETVWDPTVRAAVVTRGSGAAVTLTQPTAVLDQATLLRFFECGWKGRPGGAATDLAVQLVRYAAARHGAEVEVSSGPAAGTTVSLSLR
jgi:ParB-like chromosome segregation protein Spo0J